MQKLALFSANKKVFLFRDSKVTFVQLVVEWKEVNHCSILQVRLVIWWFFRSLLIFYRRTSLIFNHVCSEILSVNCLNGLSRVSV